MSESRLTRSTFYLVKYASVLIVCLILPCAVSFAQLSIEVQIGFAGQFMSDRYTPVQVSLKYQGPALTGDLVIFQESQHPLDEAKRFSESRQLRLGSNANQRINFYFPVSQYPWPGTEEAALMVQLSSGGSEIYSERIAIPGNVESEPLVLGVSETGFLRTLPTGERIKNLEPGQLPEDWRGYHGVRRIYLGRIRTDQFSIRQQEAIEQWILRGGELVVLGGENFYLQDSPWIRELIPFDVEAIQPTDASSELPAFVKGTATGEVLAKMDQVPLLVMRPLGNGAVYFATIGLDINTGLEQPLWNSLRSAESHREDILDLGAEVLARFELPYPSKPLIGGILVLYLAGFAYFSLWVLRQPLSTLLSSLEGGTARRRRQGWKVVAFAAGWMILFSVPSLGYLLQPVFHGYFHSVEAGVLTSEEGQPWAWAQDWYSVVSKKERTLGLHLRNDTIIVPLHETEVALAQSEPELWNIQFSPSPMKSWSTHHLYSEEMLPLQIRVLQNEDTSNVRGSSFQVYNESRWDLRDVAIFRNGAYYPLGDLPSGKSREARLDGLGDAVWPRLNEFSGRWTPEEQTKDAIMNKLKIVDTLKRGDHAWVLLAWVDFNQFTSDPREIRHGQKLVMIQSKERR